jgi:hypothetical protein
VPGRRVPTGIFVRASRTDGGPAGITRCGRIKELRVLQLRQDLRKEGFGSLVRERTCPWYVPPLRAELDQWNVGLTLLPAEMTDQTAPIIAHLLYRPSPFESKSTHSPDLRKFI